MSLRVAKDPSVFMRTAKTDQTGRMPRLIQVFAGRTDHFVCFVMRWRINEIGVAKDGTGVM